MEPRPSIATLSLVVPVYFNGASLPQVFDELVDFEGQLARRDMKLDLVFVDDGSGDDSYAQLLSFQTRRRETKVMKLARNFGAPAAVKMGLKFASGDCVVLFAADLQEPLPQVLLMVDHWRDGHRFVVSTRASRADPLATRIFASVYYRLIRVMIARDYPKGGIGLMLIDRVMVPMLVNGGKHVNPNMYAFWLGFPPLILQYHRRPRRHGRSRWTFSKKFTYFVDTATGFSPAPIRLISAVGVGVAALSFIYGLYMIYAALAWGFPLSGFATIVVLNAFLGGSTLVMLGIIGEYLWRVFDHVSGRPEAVIETVSVSEEPVDDGSR